MKKITLLFSLIITCALSAQTVFINEINYDNTGGDVGEAIEVAGPAGTDVSGWTIERYNGSNGTMYGTADNLPGTIGDQQNGFGTVSIPYPSNGLQNGSPDGIALIDNTGTVIQFLSYEGSFTATSGTASGMTSTDIGVSEPSSDPIGQSLQLTGTGSTYSDFSWQAPSAESFGSVNTGQTFMAAMTPCAIDCPSNITVTVTGGATSSVVTYVAPSISGDCMGGFTQTAGLASGDAFPVGTTTNTFEATDANTMATVTCSFTVTVSEIVGLDLLCEDTSIELDNTGNLTITSDDVSTNSLINGYALDQTGTFAPIDISGTGTTVGLGDDSVSGALPIGFTFGFFGIDYTDFFISSNGFITFNSNGGSGCCSGQNIPNTNNPNNLIAFAWEDLDPGNGGQPAVNAVRFETIGTAPNRTLIVEFFNVDHWPSGNNITSQVHLYEGSDKVEIHTTTLNSGSGLHTMGLENEDGTIAVPVPGRNRVDFSANNDFVGFTPIDIAIDITDFDCDDAGENTVTVTATAADGTEVGSCESILTVLPQIEFTGCPVDIFTGTGAGDESCSTIVNFTTPAATSVCGTPVITQTTGPASGSAFPVGETLVEFTAEVNGVANFCSFTVTIADTTGPALDCPDNLIVSSNDSGNYTIEDYTAATDNCTSSSNIEVTQEPAAGTVVEEGSTTTVTVTAVDEAGNETVCSFDVLVDTTLSTSDSAFDNALTLFPNPTSGMVTLRNNSDISINTITVVDLNGRIVSTQNVDVTTETQVNLNALAAGVYFIQIEGDNSKVVKRIVKQ